MFTCAGTDCFYLNPVREHIAGILECDRPFEHSVVLLPGVRRLYSDILGPVRASHRAAGVGQACVTTLNVLPREVDKPVNGITIDCRRGDQFHCPIFIAGNKAIAKLAAHFLSSVLEERLREFGQNAHEQCCDRERDHSAGSFNYEDFFLWIQFRIVIGKSTISQTNERAFGPNWGVGLSSRIRGTEGSGLSSGKGVF